jgi:hypothetical protein
MSKSAISFTRASLLQFTSAYNSNRGASRFQFDGNWFVPGYARYLIEYASGQLGMKFQVNRETGEISVR